MDSLFLGVRSECEIIRSIKLGIGLATRSPVVVAPHGRAQVSSLYSRSQRGCRPMLRTKEDWLISIMLFYWSSLCSCRATVHIISQTRSGSTRACWMLITNDNLGKRSERGLLRSTSED